MNRSLRAALRLAPFICLLPLAVLAQSSNLLVLSKDARGTITSTTLSLALSANAECDQTQELIPDGSQLVVAQFALNADSNGLGTFVGLAQIITPAGRIILQGWLRGTVGINTRCGAGRQCRGPGHLEGLFEILPLLAGRPIWRGDGQLNNKQVAVLNFSADLDPRVASPVPVYDARLDGLISPPPPVTEQVIIAPDKTEYRVGELITASIANHSNQMITAFDQQTYCTIVQLQVLEGEQWMDYSVCPLNRLPAPTEILSGQKLEVKLDPQPPSPNPLPPGPGVYRLALNFQVGAGDFGASERLVVASAPFRVNPTPPAARVSVTTDRDAYDVRDVITVKINNGQDRPILTWDHKSYCSVVDLQRQEGDQWINLAPCLLLSPTRSVRIEAGRDYWLKLPPEGVATRLAPGVYRIEFTYYLVNDAGQPIGDAITVYSPLFRLTSKE